MRKKIIFLKNRRVEKEIKQTRGKQRESNGGRERKEKMKRKSQRKNRIQLGLMWNCPKC